MKILHIVPSYKPAYEYGGTIESVARLCEGLAEMGHEVRVFTTTANGKTELDVAINVEHDVEGVKVVYFKRLAKDHVHISPALWKRLYKECSRYDVVHIHSWWNILVLAAMLICRAKKVNTVLSPHGMLSEYIRRHSNVNFKQYVHSTIGKRLLKYARFHATSQAEYIECAQLIKGWKGFTLPNLVWLPALNIIKPNNRQFTLIFLSRIHPKKGIELLLEAMHGMRDKPLLKIAGTGDGTYIAKLKEKVTALGLQNSIVWMEWLDREQKFNELMHADMFVLTSYNENFANVVIEALYAGTPVLVSKEVGLSSFVQKNGLGWVCRLDKDDIASKISEAITATEKRRQINECGPKIVSSYVNPEKILPQYISQYELA